jgi:drug/metabolite transporter (DMT)-like permease
VRVTTMPPVAAATAGAVCISSSAVLMKLASTASPSVVALGRCAFALPVLGVLALREHRRWRGPGPVRGGGGSCEGCGPALMPRRSRWLARLAGVFLAADLILWSHTIAAIGAGLGTVVGNLEVLIISLLAWLVLGERPGRSLVLASPVMLAGLVLVGGLADVGGSHAYGTDPALGAGLGVGVAVLYAVYILMLRQATSAAGAGTAAAGAGTAVAAPLFEATAGAVVGSVLLGLVLGDLRLGPPWPALGWIVLLALSSQVIGWLLITVSMPRLAAGTIGALLLIQPAGSVALSYVILGEHPSLLQLAGVALVLTGVVVAVTGRSPDTDRSPDTGPAPEAGYSRRRTRIIRHASAASTDTSPSKSP